MSAREEEKSDEALVRDIALGDEMAFASFYDRYRSILFGLLVRILHSRTEAEDVLQEVFLQAWRNAGRFDPTRGRAFTWLVTMGRSRAIDRLRSNAAQNRLADKTDEATSTVATEQAADDAAMRSERGEIVRHALNELPDEQREALLLAYLEGMTQTEIAAKLNQPLGTVKTRTRSGLLKLRSLLLNKIS